MVVGKANGGPAHLLALVTGQRDVRVEARQEARHRHRVATEGIPVERLQTGTLDAILVWHVVAEVAEQNPTEQPDGSRGGRHRSEARGNQQRAQLAVALAPNPELLVLDEPFAGLDPIGVDSLSGILRELSTEGVAIVFSSHQLDLVEDVCQDVAIINKGRMVLEGDLARIKEQSTRRRLTIDVDGKPWIPDLPDIEVVTNHGQDHCVVPQDAPVANILAMAESAGAVTRFAFEPPRLTDLFREAVKS